MSMIDRLDTLSTILIKSPVMWVLILVNAAALAVVWRIRKNFFCYQQVLCTPFIMCMIGIGENRIRQEEGRG